MLLPEGHRQLSLWSGNRSGGSVMKYPVLPCTQRHGNKCSTEINDAVFLCDLEWSREESQRRGSDGNHSPEVHPAHEKVEENMALTT